MYIIFSVSSYRRCPSAALSWDLFTGLFKLQLALSLDEVFPILCRDFFRSVPRIGFNSDFGSALMQSAAKKKSGCMTLPLPKGSMLSDSRVTSSSSHGARLVSDGRKGLARRGGGMRVGA